MLLKPSKLERGDTLIEVIVALAVFGVVVVSAFAIVNKGAAQMYDSLERTQVRMLMDQQTESLIYARDQYLRSQTEIGAALMAGEPESMAAKQVWEDLSTVATSSPGVEECVATTANSFYIVRSGSNIQLRKFLSTDVSVADALPSYGKGLYIQ